MLCQALVSRLYIVATDLLAHYMAVSGSKEKQSQSLDVKIGNPSLEIIKPTEDFYHIISPIAD